LHGIKEATDAGVRLAEIAEKTGASAASIVAARKRLRNGTFAIKLVEQQAREQGQRIPRDPEKRAKLLKTRPNMEERTRKFKKTRSGGKGQQYKDRILQMRKDGYKVREIVEKLGIKDGMVNYYVYGKYGKANKIQETRKEQQNGHSSKGSAINKNICIGIAYAEVERFIGVLSERLAIPATVLRSRLSELLEHSPVRQEPRN
jgi:hypothetical protein